MNEAARFHADVLRLCHAVENVKSSIAEPDQLTELQSRIEELRQRDDMLVLFARACYRSGVLRAHVDDYAGEVRFLGPYDVDVVTGRIHGRYGSVHEMAIGDAEDRLGGAATSLNRAQLYEDLQLEAGTAMDIYAAEESSVAPGGSNAANSESENGTTTATDPISYDEIALLAGVEKKTVSNYASAWKKSSLQIGDPCSYAVVRPFLLEQWPGKSIMFSADYSELRSTIRVRSDDGI